MKAVTLRARLAALAVIVAPVLALTGCFTTDAAMSISGSDRVSGTIHVAVPAGATTREQLWEVPAAFSDGVTVENGESDGNRTATYVVRDLTFDEIHDLVDAASSDAIDLELERVGGNQVSVAGKASLARYPGAKFTLAIAFPAPVTGTNGTVDGGQTVRWTMDGGSDSTFWATSPAGSTDRDQLLLWTGLATAAGLLAALLVVLWARRDHDMRD
ncbi:LppM family (lipo)protein [Corynebacterium sp. NPDC060344]|uniref:LppM family (lipo)protein n=1 Tax=Corynebacterium sp. NPDC060344 TaxID=3347101 RepID=UPI00364F21F3